MMKRSDLPPLPWLRAFEAAARHLSFTLAAREIHITQSAVSQHVRNLEDYLGCQLFIRKTRAIELTEAGENYLPIVSNAFHTIAAGTNSLIRTDPDKNLTIHCNLAFATFWLTPRLAELEELLPSINLNLVTPIWDPERVADNTAMEIRFGLPTSMPDNAIRLSFDTYFPVAAPDYQGDKVSCRLFDCAGITANWQSWLASQDELKRSAANVSFASTYVIAIGGALNGAGMAMGHDTLVSGLIAEGRLIKPFSTQCELSEAYFLIPPAGELVTAASQVFGDWLLQQMHSGADPDQIQTINT